VVGSAPMFSTHTQASKGKDKERQVDLDLKHLDRRRGEAGREPVSEPAAIEELYEVTISRLTPVGLVVAWRESMT